MRARAYIDQAALGHNYRQMKQRAAHKKVLAMLKSNAYGHDVMLAAQGLSEADYFGVVTFEEALNLREWHLNPILLMSGVQSKEELGLAIKNNIDIVVHQFHHLSLLASVTDPVRVWLKINTGMNRLGFLPADFVQAYQQLKNLKHVEIVALMSHFACADEKDHPLNHKQLETFRALTAHLPEQKSLSASSAILNGFDALFDIVRPGLSLYGISSLKGHYGRDFGLKPVMHLISEIVSIYDIQPHDTVGYGATWQATRPSKIAVVQFGYGDGYVRHNKKVPVLVKGEATHIIGRTSMDYLAIDLTDIKTPVNIGDEVTLWGTERLPVEEVAEALDMSPYPLVTTLARRVVRVPS